MKSLTMHQMPLLGRFIQPRLNGEYERDEALQVYEILESLKSIATVWC